MSRPPPAPPAAVLFDLDGTLVDSEPVHHQSTNAVLTPHGHHLDWDDYARYIGMSEDAYLAELKRRFDLPETVPELVSLRTMAHAKILGNSRLALLDGMQAVLDLLASAAIPLAIASPGVDPADLTPADRILSERPGLLALLRDLDLPG